MPKDLYQASLKAARQLAQSAPTVRPSALDIVLGDGCPNMVDIAGGAEKLFCVAVCVEFCGGGYQHADDRFAAHPYAMLAPDAECAEDLVRRRVIAAFAGQGRVSGSDYKIVGLAALEVTQAVLLEELRGDGRHG